MLVASSCNALPDKLPDLDDPKHKYFSQRAVMINEKIDIVLEATKDGVTVDDIATIKPHYSEIIDSIDSFREELNKTFIPIGAKMKI